VAYKFINYYYHYYSFVVVVVAAAAICASQSCKTTGFAYTLAQMESIPIFTHGLMITNYVDHIQN